MDSLRGIVNLRGAIYAALAVALFIYWKQKQRKANRKKIGLIEAAERHTLEALPQDPVVKTRKVCLGWIENGILRISRDRGGAMKVMVVLQLCAGKKKLPKGPFKQALRALQRRHPALRSILRKEPDTDSFFFEEQLDESNRSEVPVFWSERKDSYSYLEIWERECPKFSVDKNAVALYVLEGNGASEILFVMDHFFCDGLSVVNLFKELMTLTFAYEVASETGEKIDEVALIGPPLPWQMPMEVANARSFPNAAIQWFKVFHYILKHVVMEPKMVDFPIFDKSITADQIYKKCVCNPYRTTIPRDTVKRLLKVCKENKLTMGAAVAVSTLYAIRDIVAATPEASELSDRDLAVPLALDMRRRYTEKMGQEHLGYNISSNKAYKINFVDACKEGPVSKEIMLRRAEKMSKFYQDMDYAGAVFGTLLGPFFEQPPTFDNMSSVAITNWGRLDFPPSFGDFQVKELFGMPNNPHYIMPTLVCSTLNGQLTISIVISEPAVAESSAREFLLKLEENLTLIAA